MQIHVVTRGDSIWEIARRYGVDASMIIQVNGMANPDVLVVGQAIVIPDPFPTYVVKEGDTLYFIALRMHTTVEAIVDRNNITDHSQLYVGQTLIIPVHTVQSGETLSAIAKRYQSTVQAISEANSISNPELVYPGTHLTIPLIRPVKEVFAYMNDFGPTAQAEIRDIGKYLTFIGPFSYFIKRDGSLTNMQDTGIIAAAHSQKVASIMVVSNFEKGAFSTELAHAILSSSSLQETLLTNILNTMRSKNYRGVNFDIEYVDPKDREAYNQFLRRAVAKLRPLGYSVSTAVPPKYSSAQTGALYEGQDYAAQGKIVDFIVIMTYDWGWFGGRAMPIAPLNEVKKVLDYAVTVIPRNKIMMGVSLYGRDWTLPFVQGTFADTISGAEAVNRAARFGASIQYNEKAESPFFTYYDHLGKKHEVWFEDARSVKAKYEVAKQYNLRGVAYWVLGLPFTQNWYVLQEAIKPKKV
ncbi:LysM peptidoglycan-binding domain-containing protein [Fictibacillus sp. Mic-4]|uniref:LysM peptidoglycan-binding domain-containing protein n=1 Tax=Fictibacillus sp. Mic-4 TaxID=3132826 RepID=UPI003CEB1171